MTGKPLTEYDTRPVGNIPAGSVSTWLRKYKQSLAGGKPSSPPCGNCNSCCQSGYKVDLRPGEENGLDVDKDDKGYYIKMDDSGVCTYLVNGKCSIYDRRPKSCRDYDCRLFFFCGIVPRGKPLLADAVFRWKPVFNIREDHEIFVALRLAAHDIYSSGKAENTEDTCNAACINIGAYLPQAKVIAKSLLAMSPEDRAKLTNGVKK